MTRTEEIMEMANDHALAYSLDADWRRTHDKLKTAIEELVADAEKWREYKARKDAVIAAGMGKKAILKLWERTYVQRGTSGIEFARAIEAHILGENT